ncbi:tyrosine-type recombinase/integrase [Puniceibacterium confluentis]|uniref:tyrosine-type recombinase/integrase n=1 Tax=Puniceibacterium confluentis TaxID=1958944 RepID=UPI0011B58B45|nr:site-specific integrase [Puniceibacterium confluentis]
MASIRKHAKGWRAEVARQGVRKSMMFPTRQEAKDWAARQEYEILNSGKLAAAKPFGEVMDRYAREVSSTKRGARWEIIRLEKMRRDRIASVQVGKLAAVDFSDWRDRRLREVAPSSVLREMELMSSVLTVARRDWGMIAVNPMKDVRRPRAPNKRDRLPTADEMDRLAFVAGEDLTKSTARAFHAFLFAIETAMRAGEITGLTWNHIHIDQCFAHLPETKNGTARDVPLSAEAVRLLQALPHSDRVFGLTSASLDALWRSVRDRAGADGLTFHDSRHVAITRLSRKLDVLALARMVGHKNISELMTYYDATAADLAKRLD